MTTPDLQQELEQLYAEIAAHDYAYHVDDAPTPNTIAWYSVY